MELFDEARDSVDGGHVTDIVFNKNLAVRPSAPESDPKEEVADTQEEPLPTIENLEVYRIVFELFDR
jgi:hypothetical protein